MPLVAHSNLPTFERLRKEGEAMLSPDWALQQDIRELHIGILNMMPDGALTATERQFFRLIGESNQIAQFYVHPFTLPELKRSAEVQAYVDSYYESFAQIKQNGLDALIITGANVTQPSLEYEPFWHPLIEIIDWAYHNVTSTLCSCLATHAVLQFRHGQKRQPLSSKCWGVFKHRVINNEHPLIHDVNTLFDVPHSRYNEVTRQQFEQAGLHVLVESDEVGVQLAVSEDQFRMVYFQGHPEYDTISLLKEYKREINRFIQGDRKDQPPFPDHYFSRQAQAILEEYQNNILIAKQLNQALPDFPEQLITSQLDNTWHDTGEAIINNWIGKVYQVTNQDRKLPFMEDVDPENPLGLS